MATSRRPYLIRAIYDWVLDNGYTPYLLVAANESDVVVPAQYVGEDGKIVMNLSPTAVRGLELGNEFIRFEARFSGTPFKVFFPAGAVLAVYAKETGEGMLFGDPEETGVQEPEAQTETLAFDEDSPASDSTREDSDESPDDEPPSPSGRRKRGHLTVIK